jgi:hypothetical protein
VDRCRKSRLCGIRSPDLPAHSESLYRLSYPGSQLFQYQTQFQSLFSSDIFVGTLAKQVCKATIILVISAHWFFFSIGPIARIKNSAPAKQIFVKIYICGFRYNLIHIPNFCRNRTKITDTLQKDLLKLMVSLVTRNTTAVYLSTSFSY